MQLSRDNIQKAGDRAFFVSRELNGTTVPKCMSFWYYMYEPIVDTTGPNLGKLAIWTRTIDRYSVDIGESETEKKRNKNISMTIIWAFEKRKEIMKWKVSERKENRCRMERGENLLRDEYSEKGRLRKATKKLY